VLYEYEKDSVWKFSDGVLMHLELNPTLRQEFERLKKSRKFYNIPYSGNCAPFTNRNIDVPVVIKPLYKFVDNPITALEVATRAAEQKVMYMDMEFKPARAKSADKNNNNSASSSRKPKGVADIEMVALSVGDQVYGMKWSRVISKSLENFSGLLIGWGMENDLINSKYDSPTLFQNSNVLDIQYLASSIFQESSLAAVGKIINPTFKKLKRDYRTEMTTGEMIQATSELLMINQIHLLCTTRLTGVLSYIEETEGESDINEVIQNISLMDPHFDEFSDYYAMQFSTVASAIPPYGRKSSYDANVNL
jgi:hypothetical protein